MFQTTSERYRKIIEDKLRQDPAAFQGNKGHDTLYWMFRDGCSDHLDVVIRHGCDINAPDAYNKTLLFHAAQVDNAQALKKLLELGADPYSGTYSVSNEAITSASESLAIYLLEKAPPRNETEEDMLMMTAIRAGRAAVVQYLLDYGYPPDKKISGCYTPLYFAASENNVAVLKVLVDNGADINLNACHGDTPLIRAVELAQFDSALWLLDHGADGSLSNHFGANALAKCSSAYPLPPRLQQKLFKANRVSDHIHGSPNLKAFTPLMGAATNGDVVRLSLLLQDEALIDHRDREGFTALHYAARKGSSACVKKLLEHGADANAKTGNNETPLTLTLRSYGEKHFCVEALLNYGAIAAVTDSRGYWASQIAAVQGLTDTTKLLTAKAMTESGSPIWQQHLWTAKLVDGLLHNNPLLVQEVVSDQQLAAASFVEIIKENLERIFFAAVEHGRIDAVQFLLDGGADVDCIDGDSNTPLNIAARYSQIEVAKLLLQHGANLEAETERGYTPIQFAKTKAMYDFLRGRGAKDGFRVA